MHPGGVEGGLASDAAQKHLAVGPENLEQVILRSAAQSSVERLAIYADAYYARLLECLAEEFPILRKTLGEETFEAFAFDYLQCYPSQSYTLGKLGENFARYLAETRPWKTPTTNCPRIGPSFSSIWPGWNGRSTRCSTVRGSKGKLCLPAARWQESTPSNGRPRGWKWFPASSCWRCGSR